jgi:hypothetical protein
MAPCQHRLLEHRARWIWCIGGPSMSIREVAFYLFMTPETLRGALGHIPNLGYVSIRRAGLELLFLNDSLRGAEIGFLVDGSVFEILELDAEESRRLEKEREELLQRFMKKKK